MLRAVRHYAELGIRQVPCDGKCPLWKGWPERATDDVTLLRNAIRNGMNMAALTGGRSKLVVIDLDSMTFANRLHDLHPEVFKVYLETRRGVHVYMRHPEIPVPSKTRANIEGIEADIKGEKNLALLPPSQIEGYTYRFMRGHELQDIDSLPVFPKAWIPQRKEIVILSAIPEGDVGRRFENARCWLAHRPPAVSGSGGHNQMFGAACSLFRFYRLTPELAWVALVEYNCRAVPPFSEKDLRHKWIDAMKKSQT